MNHPTARHVWCTMTNLLRPDSLLRRAVPLARLSGLTLAAALCAAAAASAAEPAAETPGPAAEQPAPKAATIAEAAPQPAAPKTAAQAAAAANAAATAAEAPAAPAARAAPTRDPNAPVIRDEEPITPPPGPPPPGTRPYTRRSRRLVEAPEAPRGEARQGLLFSIGAGGASQFTSTPGLGRTASTDLDLRIGYGFSDRLQMFVDFNGQSARYGYGQHTSMGSVTLRAQTVLIGDRKGNGLTLNGGIGLGSFNPDAGSDYGYGNDYWGGPRGGRFYDDRPLGFVVAGGLSYDARLGRYLSLSPELFATWMAIPNDDRRQDIATQMGLRIKLLWYLK
jgi:hypothetical protein